MVRGSIASQLPEPRLHPSPGAIKLPTTLKLCNYGYEKLPGNYTSDLTNHSQNEDEDKDKERREEEQSEGEEEHSQGQTRVQARPKRYELHLIIY